jgi:trimeric autotransporter adhesin
MAFSVTDNLSFTGTGTNSSTHLNNVANGDASIIGIATGLSATGAISSVTDSQGNTYVRAGQYAGTLIEVELWYSLNATLDNTTTITVTPAVGTTVWSAVWCVVSGVATTSAFDVTAGTSGTSGTSSNSGSTSTTSDANEIIFGLAGQANNRPFSAGSGYTSINQTANTNLAEVFLEYKIVSATGSYNATASWDLSSNWAMGVFTFGDTAINVTTTSTSQSTSTSISSTSSSTSHSSTSSSTSISSTSSSTSHSSTSASTSHSTSTSHSSTSSSISSTSTSMSSTSVSTTTTLPPDVTFRDNGTSSNWTTVNSNTTFGGNNGMTGVLGSSPSIHINFSGTAYPEEGVQKNLGGLATIFGSLVRPASGATLGTKTIFTVYTDGTYTNATAPISVQIINQGSGNYGFALIDPSNGYAYNAGSSSFALGIVTRWLLYQTSAGWTLYLNDNTAAEVTYSHTQGTVGYQYVNLGTLAQDNTGTYAGVMDFGEVWIGNLLTAPTTPAQKALDAYYGYIQNHLAVSGQPYRGPVDGENLNSTSSAMDTVSEGASYLLRLAVQNGDQTSFNLCDNWVLKNLLRYNSTNNAGQFVQIVGSASSGSATSLSVIPTVTTRYNDTCIVVVKGSSARNASSVTDTQGNTWSLVTNTSTADTISIYIAVMTSPLSPSDTITVTMTGTANTCAAGIYEYSGILTASPIDGTPTSTSVASNTTATSSSVTTTNAADILISAFTLATSQTVAVSSPFTSRGFIGGSSSTVALADYTPGSTGSYTTTWTWSTATTSAIALIALKPSPTNTQNNAAPSNAYNLMAYHYNSANTDGEGIATIYDANWAADADADRCQALLWAHGRWGSSGYAVGTKLELLMPNYKQRALNIAADLKAYAIANSTNTGYNYLLNDSFQLGNTVVQLAPDYNNPALYQLLAQYDTTNANFWTTTVSGSNDIIQKVATVVFNGQSGAVGLNANWVAFNLNTGLVSTSASTYDAVPNFQYGFNAFRSAYRMYDMWLFYTDANTLTSLREPKSFFTSQWGSNSEIFATYLHDGTSPAGYELTEFTFAAYWSIYANDTGNTTASAINSNKLSNLYYQEPYGSIISEIPSGKQYGYFGQSWTLTGYMQQNGLWINYGQTGLTTTSTSSTSSSTSISSTSSSTSQSTSTSISSTSVSQSTSTSVSSTSSSTSISSTSSSTSQSSTSSSTSISISSTSSSTSQSTSTSVSSTSSSISTTHSTSTSISSTSSSISTTQSFTTSTSSTSSSMSTSQSTSTSVSSTSSSTSTSHTTSTSISSTSSSMSTSTSSSTSISSTSSSTSYSTSTSMSSTSTSVSTSTSFSTTSQSTSTSFSTSSTSISTSSSLSTSSTSLSTSTTASLTTSTSSTSASSTTTIIDIGFFPIARRIRRRFN